MSNKHIEVNESEKQANPIFNYLSIVLVLVGLGLFYGLKADGWIKWILFVVSFFISNWD